MSYSFCISDGCRGYLPDTTDFYEVETVEEVWNTLADHLELFQMECSDAVVIHPDLTFISALQVGRDLLYADYIVAEESAGESARILCVSNAGGYGI